MSKIIKLTESDLTNIVKKIINESYDPERLYDRELVLKTIKKGPFNINKYTKLLPIIQCGDKICTKIPEIIYLYLKGGYR
jgi:hypothetical protein